jgi:hypothetical protein
MDAMNRLVRARACVAVIAGASILVLVAGTASAAAVPCAQRVIGDWSDNGRIDAAYQLHCYEDAIDVIPLDLRDYSNAVDVIGRALAIALRSQATPDKSGRAASEATPEVDTSGASPVPIPLLALGGMSIALLAAGGLGYLSGRRNAARPADPGDEETIT